MNARLMGVGAALCFGLLAGCETSTQSRQVDPEAGVLKRANPAAILNGEQVELSGLVQVQKAGQRVIPAPAFGSSNRALSSIALEQGPCEVTLESSFNRDGKIFIFQGDMAIEVEPGVSYYPVAGLEANTGKAWMWIQDDLHKVRASERVEARFVKIFEPEKENYLDIISYEAIIDPDVMAERKAACDLTQVPGYQEDLSLDRGDESYYRRDN